MNCQDYIERYISTIEETIRRTEKDDHEHSFGFNEHRTTDILRGECNDVPRPEIDGMVGTFHVHTIEHSNPSDEDIELFHNTPDSLMCYATPRDNNWIIRCFDKDMQICGESLYSNPIDK